MKSVRNYYLRALSRINLCHEMETIRLLGVTVTTVTEEHLLIGISFLIIDAQTGPQTPAEITGVCETMTVDEL